MGALAVISLFVTILGQTEWQPLHVRTPQLEHWGRSETIDNYSIRFEYPKPPINSDSTYFRLELNRRGKLVKSIRFGQAEVGPVGHVGDPKRPPFLVKRAGMRVVLYDVIVPGYAWVPYSFGFVVQVKKSGILAGRGLASLCLVDPSTMKLTWERRFGMGIRDVRPSRESIRIELNDGRIRQLSWTTGMNL